MMKKRLLSALLAVAMLASLLTVGASAETTGTYGDLTYSIENNEVTITSCDGLASGTIVIPDRIKGYPVTAIGEGAFLMCGSITGVVIPDSVTYIGSTAFAATGLTQVEIPDSVSCIDSLAFSMCDDLQTVLINPDDSGAETRIMEYAFARCGSLSQLYLGEGLTQIGDHAFEDCPCLTEVFLPKSIAEIGEYALGFICEDDAYYLVDGFTIYAFINTAGVDYALENDIPCGLLYCQFADDNGKGTWTWASEYIYTCTAYGLVSGYEDNTFRPDRKITRAEFVTMLYKAFQAAGGIDESTGGHPFTDCPASWYQPYISWAYQYGVVNGTSETTFSPNASITRQDMAVMLYNYLQIFYGMEPVSCDLSQFPDQGSISGYARPAVEFCVAYGLINGMANKDGTVTVSPKSSTTRAQAATVLYNTFLDPGEDAN